MPTEHAFEPTIVRVPKSQPKSEQPQEPDSGQREIKIPTGVNVDLTLAIGKLTPEQYLPKLMARGGEHLVFEFDDPKHRNVVYKVNFHQTLPFLRQGVLYANERAAAERVLQEQINLRKDQVTILRDYFGHKAVPVQRLLVRDIPVSREAIRQLRPSAMPDSADTPGRGDEFPQTVPAWVSIQRRLAIDPERTVMLRGFYPESPTQLLKTTDPDAGAVYDEAHDLLVGRAGEAIPHEEQVEMAIDMFSELESVRRRLANPEFRASVRETAKRLVDFTNETGIPLDVAGRNNIFLFQGEHGWEVKMPDALSPDLDLQTKDLTRLAGILKRGETLTGADPIKALNLLNTVRFVNALAVVAGIRDRVTVPGLKDVPGSSWREMFHDAKVL